MRYKQNKFKASLHKSIYLHINYKIEKNIL